MRISLRQWFLERPWHSFQQKAPYVLLGMYVLPLHDPSAFDLKRFFILLPCALLFLWAMITLSYLIHDYSDKKEDARAQKPNLFQFSIPFASKSALMLLCLGGLLAPWLALRFSIHVGALFLLHTSLVLLYTVGRLKRYPHIAPILDSLYAYVLPVLTAAYVLALSMQVALPSLVISLISIWMFVLGFRHYLNHLALDQGNDKQSAHTTLATQYGTARLYAWVKGYLLPIEGSLGLISLGFILGRVSEPSLQITASIGLSLLAYHFWKRILFAPLYRFTHTPWDAFTRSAPILLLLALCAYQSRYLPLLVLHIGLFHRAWSQTCIQRYLRPMASLCVNYSIYCFRKYAQGQNELQARRPHADAYVLRQARQTKTKRRGCVVVVNLHKEKYTETFVRGPLAHLPMGVHYLYGGAVPKYRDEGIALSTTHKQNALSAHTHASTNTLSKDEDDVLRFLIKRNIKAVLAHFGPVGVAMLPICQAAGIPLMVYFHSYDVFNQKTLSKHKADYQPLFRYASRLLCASREIQQRLCAYGAPPNKVFYLPPYVDVERFSYMDHSQNAPDFLFVGRFCDTKCPHLVLMAFQILLRHLPEARLTMIGKDGGGALYESCVVLAKALGIEARVHFRGIRHHDEVAKAMERARALVLPSWSCPLSGDREGTPVVALEAAASGLPLIATPHAGVKELFAHKKTALFVRPYDFHEWAQCMMQIAHNDKQAYKMGQNASHELRPLIQQHCARLTQHFDMISHA